jgi:alpha,alpha-trehalase
MLTLNTLRADTVEILRYIEYKWHDLRANARGGHRDRFASWVTLAASSADGHLDDTDPAEPYILFLPNDFITPGGRFMVQFYWDSYFINLSLLRSRHIDLARGMVENCFHLIGHHGMVIANRKRWAAGSQLPFLSRMVRDIFEVTQDRAWLATAVEYVKAEYNGYWLNREHLVDVGLSRYHAPPCYPAAHLAAITMDHEATWDLSPRFDTDDVLHLLPVDLNSNLYGYECDLARMCDELGRHEEGKHWNNVARKRAELINSLMWDERSGLYFDFDFVKGRRKCVRSLATYFPLFHGIADENRAAQVVNSISLFQKEHGLATCDHSYGYTDRQWNFPVGWAPLHWISYVALKRNGYDIPAQRLALRWLSLILDVWKHTGKIFEKYDVQYGNHEVLTDRYRNQDGFGWTNAVFHVLVEELIAEC